METYLTIEELASHLKLAVQTIRRYVLNREIPFCKIKKVIRFRLSDIEKWIAGGAKVPVTGIEEQDVDLSCETETGDCKNKELENESAE
jgi:excisionase family DNA binding protein